MHRVTVEYGRLGTSVLVQNMAAISQYTTDGKVKQWTKQTNWNLYHYYLRDCCSQPGLHVKCARRYCTDRSGEWYSLSRNTEIQSAKHWDRDALHLHNGGIVCMGRKEKVFIPWAHSNLFSFLASKRMES